MYFCGPNGEDDVDAIAHRRLNRRLVATLLRILVQKGARLKLRLYLPGFARRAPAHTFAHEARA